MESDDDYQSFSPSKETSSPINQPKKLKRLKKKISVDLNIAVSEPTPSLSTFDISPILVSDISKTVEVVTESEGFEDVGRNEENSELEELFVYKERSEEDKILMMDWEEEDRFAQLDEKVGDAGGEEKFGDEEIKENKGEKKRGSLKKEGEKKKKRKLEKPIPVTKKMEKERKAHLKELHAESQRLLRETRDAAFKPVPLVQKPISSILEKIRQRKLEVSKKLSILNNHVENNNFSREVVLDLHQEQVCDDILGEDKELVEEEGDMPFVNEGSNGVDTSHVESASKPASLPSPNKPILSNTPLDEESKCAFRDPINDTQDLSDGFQTSDEEDLEVSEEDSPVEEVLAPSVLTMNLKLDSAPPDDISSDEEDDDKENIDPRLCKAIEEDVYPKGDPVKAFVDDEAEEEDDSDNDLMRFKENEEDEENEESEEFNDLIVSGYKEKPIDNAKRDQLHQMWLEQQDAAATDNVLQRLKCGGNQLREPIALEGEDEKEADGEDFIKDSMDDASCDLLPQNIARINSKKAKQMMSQMFTDKDDVFLSSDDEETEQKLVRIRLLEKAEERSSFLSPAEDDNSREVFGLIKKLNIAPDPKKKAKSSSFFDKLVTGGNSNSSSKSSFLGRARNSSLPSSKKTGSSSFKSFIFGRDDSNSRSAITTPEVSSNTGDNTNRPTKTASAKFSNSQSKFSSQRTSQTSSSSSSSLLEILRRSTKSDHSVRNNTSGQTEVAVQFAAFKSVKRSMKVEART